MAGTAFYLLLFDFLALPLIELDLRLAGLFRRGHAAADAEGRIFRAGGLVELAAGGTVEQAHASSSFRSSLLCSGAVWVGTV